MADPVFDKQEQLDLVTEGLLPGEQVLYVFDAVGAGTGFIGVTDRRVLVQDNSFAGKQVALTSIPFSRINAVSVVSDKSVFGRLASSSQIAVTAGSREYAVEFRGEDKAKLAHDAILSRVLG